MSSSQDFLASSPVSASGTRRAKSAFTYKHLNQLANYSTTSPLRVIAHIEYAPSLLWSHEAHMLTTHAHLSLDAFYAQCEMVRLGVARDQPLAVQQWQGLIAINYAARAFNLTRHVTCAEAKRACPNIILQHVATWREGDDRWAYHEDAFAQIATHKVSLDPYRLQSRRILATIKEYLPAKLQRVEKASIDEVFLDLSAQVHALLLERFPMLKGPAPYDDPSELLPRPPTTALDWDTDALVDLDEKEREQEDPDWDDVALSIASEIVRGVRAQVWEKLQYTCSAGVAKNKMLAKLGSAHKKPNKQTIVRNRAVGQFLGGFKFTKIRNLGGKLGDEVVAAFGTDQVSELLGVSLEQLKGKFSDDTAAWLYGVIRGEDQSEVNPRTQIKSMLSAKSFRPSINSIDVAAKWLRIFVADIFSRLVEEGVLDNKRRPRTINLHHRQGAQTRSRQAPIPSGRAIDEAMLYDLAKALLGQVVVDGRAWPCANLSLSVGGFEDGVKDNKGIGNFLVRGDEAKAMMIGQHEGRVSELDEPSAKRRRVDGGIRTFFGRREESSHGEAGHRDETEDSLAHREDSQEGAQRTISGRERGSHDDTKVPPLDCGGDSHGQAQAWDRQANDAEDPFVAPPSGQQQELQRHEQQPQTEQAPHTCSRCGKSIRPEEQGEHDDWHFARDLQRQESQMVSAPQEMGREESSSAAKPGMKSNARPARKGGGGGGGRNGGGPGKDDRSVHKAKAQSRLAFG